MRVSIDLKVEGYMLVYVATRMVDEHVFDQMWALGLEEEGNAISYNPSQDVITAAIVRAKKSLTKLNVKNKLKETVRVNGTSWFDTWICDPSFGVDKKDIKNAATLAVAELFDYDDIKREEI